MCLAHKGLNGINLNDFMKKKLNKGVTLILKNAFPIVIPIPRCSLCYEMYDEVAHSGRCNINVDADNCSQNFHLATVEIRTN